ncbi:hypothetical protein HanRHA438_Chr07g0301851 [Helianthus annuus]|nr:hypothetical protein HanHA300_Chr07g0239571 [Helianthus annuus]KAJ0556478.1 hypothetical protein HanIR_Chr07g0314331 [Helianthus annuus]KAJ0562881.1 hypothetical protein HanHA89_Chr07g0256781 [Helianthus annuus]KAJ0731021.1 hypothetical protein HanOQP8_Chr07g0247171 [Helianthus annuus]KAJ0907675.1 hypothetical protein HanRHA438_Chr07g0301851 [Helianthus annuus]
MDMQVPLIQWIFAFSRRFNIFFCLLDLLLDDDSFCFNHTEQMPVHLILIGFCIKVLIPI